MDVNFFPGKELVYDSGYDVWNSGSDGYRGGGRRCRFPDLAKETKILNPSYLR